MKIDVLIIFLFLSISIYGQVAEQGQYWDVNHNSNELIRYKLYPTANRYNFIKLDTKYGNMTLVQYDVQGDDEFEYFLDSVHETIPDSVAFVGRYELYPTKNNYTFLLIDQIDGYVYHVQWSLKRVERFVKKIRYSFGQ